MYLLPQIIRDAWADHDGPTILATVDEKGIPNIIYVGCVGIYKENLFVIADNYFDKTQKNIHSGSKGALLFIDSKGKSYQIKGSLKYHKDDDIFTYMKTINPPQHPGHAAVVLHMEEAYSGAEKLF